MHNKKFFFIILVSFIILNQIALAEDDTILQLTDKTFDEYIATHDYVLVKFYAEWCGHCKHLAPEFAKAAKVLEAQTPIVNLVKVDAPENRYLSEKYGISGYPNLKFFAKGEITDYKAGRTEKDIIGWVSKRVGNLYTYLNTSQQFDDFLKQNKVAVVLFSKEEGDLYNIYKSVLMGYDRINFGIASDNAVIEHAKTQYGKVVLFKQFDEGRSEYNGDNQIENLTEFIELESAAIVMGFDDDAIERVFQKKNPTVLLFCDHSEKCVKADEEFANAAKASKGGKVLFSSLKEDDGLGNYQRLADYLEASLKDLPFIMLIHKQEEIKKFRFTNEITQKNLEQFVKEFKDGTLDVKKKDDL